MLQTLFEKKEKKVEYLELIYDLIFVYIIGRNNSLLHHLENGFLTWDLFLPYLLCTLAVIQIWMYSTYYIFWRRARGCTGRAFTRSTTRRGR